MVCVRKETIDKTIDTSKVLKRETRKIKQATGQPIKAGRPKKQGYTKEKGDEILELISNGMTVTQACARAGIKRLDFLRWTEVVPDLKLEYSVALKRLAGALVDGVLIDVESVKSESDSRMLVNKHKVISWAAGNLDNDVWGVKKSYEVGGQIKIQHSHELTAEQKERIASAWLMSREIPLPKGKVNVTIEAEPVYRAVDGEMKLLEVEEVAKIQGVPASRKVEDKAEILNRKAERAANPELDAGGERPERCNSLKSLGQKVLNHFPSADRLAQQSFAKTKAELESIK